MLSPGKAWVKVFQAQDSGHGESRMVDKACGCRVRTAWVGGNSMPRTQQEGRIVSSGL
jgi:hypothetical protein